MPHTRRPSAANGDEREAEQVIAECDLMKGEGAALAEKTQKAQESWSKKERSLQAEAAALQEKGIEVDRKNITVDSVKTLGEFEATAKLHREVKATIKFAVVAE